MDLLDKIKGVAIGLTLLVLGVVASWQTGRWLPVVFLSFVLAPISWFLWFMTPSGDDTTRPPVPPPFEPIYRLPRTRAADRRRARRRPASDPKAHPLWDRDVD